MPIERLLDAVERRGDIGRDVAALALPISNRPGMTFSCTGKIGLREPGEHTSGPNLASRDNVAHVGILNDSRIAGILGRRIYASAHLSYGDDTGYSCAARTRNGSLRAGGAKRPRSDVWRRRPFANRAFFPARRAALFPRRRFIAPFFGAGLFAAGYGYSSCWRLMPTAFG